MDSVELRKSLLDQPTERASFGKSVKPFFCRFMMNVRFKRQSEPTMDVRHDCRRRFRFLARCNQARLEDSRPQAGFFSDSEKVHRVLFQGGTCKPQTERHVIDRCEWGRSTQSGCGNGRTRPDAPRNSISSMGRTRRANEMHLSMDGGGIVLQIDSVSNILQETASKMRLVSHHG